MKHHCEFLYGRRGMVLVNSLTLLSVLMAAGIGAAVMLQNDFRVLSNLRGGTEAFYISVAGVEWAKSEIAGATSLPPAPSNQSKPFSTGQFVVSFLPSTMTGPLTARMIVHSTGTSNGAQNVVHAQLTKSYDLADAALALRGNAAQISLNADGIFISGADHDPITGSVTGAKSLSSMSAANDAMRALVLGALGTPPRHGILHETADMPATATSSYLPAGLITQLATDLCASPTASMHAISSGGLTIENQSWGTSAAPQLHCIEGISGSGDAATMAGNVAGAGILVIKNADLVLSGTFRWAGLVLVTGNDVSLKTIGLDIKELLGAVILHETGIPAAGRKILEFEGAIRILFSRRALSQASYLVPPATANIAYESLPSGISQDYWRSVAQ